MKNGNSAVFTLTNDGPDLYGENNLSGSRDVSSLFPRYENNETPKNIPQNNLVLSHKDFLNRNSNNDAITYSIIRVFAGEPQRHAPTIKNQKSSQSLIDFFGRGLNAQGPATHSNSAPKHPQQSVEKHGSFLEFLGNPFGKPSSSIQPDRYSSVTYQGKCQYV